MEKCSVCYRQYTGVRRWVLELYTKGVRLGLVTPSYGAQGAMCNLTS